MEFHIQRTASLRSVISCPGDGLRSTSQTARSARHVLVPGSDKLIKYTAATRDAKSIGIAYASDKSCDNSCVKQIMA
eukprot:scaffold2421_cov145-Skeletonema_marinoi.AAC.4